MNATLAWVTKHMGPTWSDGPLNAYNLGRELEWDAPANPTQDGPNLTVTITAKGTGADVEIDAWTLPLGHRSANETLTGVTGATAAVTNDNGSFIQPFTVTLTTAQAERLAADINASRAYPTLEWSGLAGIPDVTVTFQTSSGARRFLAARNDYSVQPLDGGPQLWMSAALNRELNVDIPPGRSSRPPSDRHPHLPTRVTSVTATTSWPDSHRAKKPTTQVLTGDKARTLAADLAPLSQDPHAGLCTKKGRPNVDLRVVGEGPDATFSFSGDCDEVSPLNGLDGQLVIPFTATPAFEAALTRLLRH
jgi:hypothetical protein